MSQPQGPRRYELHLEGVTPLVMHSNAGLLAPAEDKGRDKLAWEKEHFMEFAYLTPANALMIPARAIKKAMIDACRFVTEKPKGTRAQSFAPFIQAAMIVEDDALLDVSVDKVIPWIAVVNLDPNKGTRGPRGARCRPMVPTPWRARTTISVFDDCLTQEALAKIATAAGMKCGLLDARAIDMGRCHITLRAATA